MKRLLWSVMRKFATGESKVSPVMKSQPWDCSPSARIMINMEMWLNNEIEYAITED